MINWKKISGNISDATACLFTIVHASPISGGYTNQAWHLEGRTESGLTDGKVHYFVKLNSADKTAMFTAERAGLAALAATHTLRVPRVIAHGVASQHAFIVLEHFDLYRNGNNDVLGAQLAALHRVQAAQFGWDRDNTLSLNPQHNTWSPDWLSFWREQRLGFQLDHAAHNGYGGKLQILGHKIMDALPDLFAGYYPAPSLLHGDLWGGNYAFLFDSTPLVFDPAPYFGDRETDIAMTELFGGFDAAFYQAYHAAYPLDAGYTKRKTLYNLYHILNHCNLVGSSYLNQAEGMMLNLLEEAR
ncbi:MAG TPA: fructosamine kinase family protein [Gallionellaceae bacterium]|nr:fructosamine kinase family protein [Gallionellaceae bacterium]